MDEQKVTVTESKVYDLLNATRELIFALETVAHLQGKERLLLPMCDKAHTAIILLIQDLKAGKEVK